MNNTEKYQEVAINKVIKFIETSTRFTPEDFVIHDNSCFKVSYTVDVRYKFSATTKVEVGSGDCALATYDVLSSNVQDTKDLSLKIISDLDHDHAVADTLLNKIKNTKYSSLRQVDLGEYYRRVMRNMACSTCDGDGHHTCGGCGGAGSITERVEHQGTIDSEHPGGTPYDTYEQVGCGGCGGSGKEQCRTCKSTGKTHSITSFQISASPLVFSLKLDNDNEAGDVRHALDKYSDLMVAHAHSDECGHIAGLEGSALSNSYTFTCPFFIAECSVNGQDGKIVMFGKTYQVANSSGLLEALIKPDLDELNAISLESGYSKSSIKAAGKVVKKFMRSELNQRAFSKVKSGAIDFTALSTSVSESLSPEYLEESVVAMERICASLNKYHAIIFIVLGALFALSVFLINFNHHFLSGLLLAALVIVLAGWVRYLSFNAHLLAVGGISLLKFVNARNICPLKWYGWKFSD